jgi:hypothetical protein
MFKYLLFTLLLITGCSDDTYAIQTSDPYYLKLEKQCYERTSPNCCLASLQGMVTTQSKLADANGTCPAGYKRVMMKCIDTYVWCEKIK